MWSSLGSLSTQQLPWASSRDARGHLGEQLQRLFLPDYLGSLKSI